MVNCAICKQEFEEDRGLHAHLKAHQLRVVEYYQTHFARYDKFDGSIIKFKSKEQYFSTDFNSALNLKKWLDAKPPEDVRDYCQNLLVKRRDRKGLIYSPTQVELRSLKFPGVNYYNKLFGDYYKLCSSLGLKNKFSKVEKFVYGTAYDNSYSILVDTREQLPLKFKRPIEIATLKFGDYAFGDSQATCNCHIERKSLADFVGTMTGGYERFEREIVRAKEAEGYLVILVEDSLSNALQFSSLPQLFKKGMKITPDFVFRRVRDLTQKYDHIQYLFVRDREESAAIIDKIFTCGCEYRKADLQYMYDKGLL